MTVRVQIDDFDAGAEVEALVGRRTDVGAVVTFTGRVRAGSEGRPVAKIMLEHYPGMTETEIERIESDARARWQLSACLIIHRVGELAPGDNIVLVATAAAHRQSAFAAAEFLMDYLKTRAPFWKKEWDPSSGGAWVEAREGDSAAAARWDAIKAAE